MMQAQDFPLISHSPRRWAAFVQSRTPILESIVPLDSRGRRRWKALENNTLAAHARWRLADGNVGGRGELAKEDKGLYQALNKRKLLDEVGLPNLRGERRDWAGMESEELVAYSKKFITENDIWGRGELAKADSGLYDALRKRKLLDEVGLADLRGEIRGWPGMGKEELVAYSKKFIEENRIGGRKELAKADSGLYEALRKRKLLDDVGLPDLNEKHRDWTGMGRRELVAYSKKFIEENRIGGRKELAKADKGLYQALRRRKLLDEVGLPSTQENNRDWAGIRKKELVLYSKKFIAEKGIGGRTELAKADSGLYTTLVRRKLLDAVFSDIEASKAKEKEGAVLRGIKGALSEYSGDGK